MARSPKKITLIGVYRLPVPLGVTHSALGKTFGIVIGGVHGRGVFPSLEWTESEPRIVMPPLDDPLPKAIDHYTRHEEPATRLQYWGFVSRWHPHKRTIASLGVSALVLRFSVPQTEVAYSDYINGLGAPTGGPVEVAPTITIQKGTKPT